MPRTEYISKYSYAVLFFTFFCVCVYLCVCVPQRLVMALQNEFSQKKMLSAFCSFDTTSTSFFQYKFFSSSLYICVCVLLGVNKYIHILWLAGSRKIHFL